MNENILKDPFLGEQLINRTIDTNKNPTPPQDSKASNDKPLPNPNTKIPQETDLSSEMGGFDEEDLLEDDGITAFSPPEYEESTDFATPDEQDGAKNKIIGESAKSVLGIANLVIPQICGYVSKRDVGEIRRKEERVGRIYKENNPCLGEADKAQHTNNANLKRFQEITEEGLAAIESPLKRIMQRESFEVSPEWELLIAGGYLVGSLGIAVIEIRKSNLEVMQDFNAKADRLIAIEEQKLREMELARLREEARNEVK
jgi:hypothetical protein